MTTACERLVTGLGSIEGLVVSSCGTWLDRVERGAVERASRGVLRAVKPATSGGRREAGDTGSSRPCVSGIRRFAHVGSMEGYLPELLSAGPLAAVAGVLLTGRLPARLFGGVAPGPVPVRSFGLLASDFAGSAAAVRVAIGDR
jgi:hypothetical protein